MTTLSPAAPELTATVRRARIAAFGLALVPVLVTVAAYVVAGAVQLSATATALVVAGILTLSGLAGLVVLRSRGRLDLLRLPSTVRLRAVWWLVPIAATPVVVLATTPPNAAAVTVPGLVWLAAAAAVNEEVWFRGLVLDRLRGRGPRSAVVGSAVLFGVLHLTNLAGGKSPAYAVLQLLFAVLFGLVAALLTILTGSLWPALLWHFAWDAVNYLAGDQLTGAALVGLTACVVMLTWYGRRLWIRLPHTVGSPGTAA